MGQEWIWGAPQWPRLTVDIDRVRQAEGGLFRDAARFNAQMVRLEPRDKDEVYLVGMVDEAMNTSAIEGEMLARRDVRSSLFVQLGLIPAMPQEKRAKGIVSALLDCRRNFFEPLSMADLLTWQEHTIGAMDVVPGWRDTKDGPMQIVSGRIDNPKVHYEAPPAERLKRELNAFVKWFNDTDPTVAGANNLPGTARAAIAHLWFEVLHPFRDGNGRIGRLIAEKALAQELKNQPLFSLSKAIEEDRRTYYEVLNRASRQQDMDVTDFAVWFASTVHQAHKKSELMVRFVIEKAAFWDRFGKAPVSVRQRSVINKVFDKGPDAFESGIAANHYQGLSKVSRATATRDLASLVDMGLLVKLEGGGRSTRYALNLPMILQRHLRPDRKQARSTPELER